MAVHRLDRDEARRTAIRAQVLDAARPHDLLEVVHRLTFLQLDPTAAVSPSADLVAWTRLGGAYDPDQLQQAPESMGIARAVASDVNDELEALATWLVSLAT